MARSLLPAQVFAKNISPVILGMADGCQSCVPGIPHAKLRFEDAILLVDALGVDCAGRLLVFVSHLRNAMPVTEMSRGILPAESVKILLPGFASVADALAAYDLNSEQLSHAAFCLSRKFKRGSPAHNQMARIVDRVQDALDPHTRRI